MTGLLDIISPYFSKGGYYIIFIMTYLETALFFGFILPGESIVVIAGLLASKGMLDFKNVFLVAALGAILGDQTGYMIGREFGQKLIFKYGDKFFFKREYLSETGKFFEKHGGKTVFIGRFAAWLRAMSPFVAGLSRMNYAKFLFFNAAGGLLWALGFSLLGYFLGDSWQQIKHVMGQAGFFALVAAVVIVFIWRLLRGKRHIIIAQLGWLDRALSKQVPLTWGFLKARLSVTRWEGLRLTAALFSIFIAFHEFGEIIESQTRKGLLYKLDTRAASFILSIKTPEFANIMYLSSVIIDIYILTAVAAGLLVFLFWRKNWWGLYAYLLAFGGGAPLLFLLKTGVGNRHGLSSRFPSIYSFGSVIVFGFLAYTAWVFLKKKITKTILISFCVFLTLLVGVSRLYWDVHWFTDVLGGYAAGFAWFVLSIVIVRMLEESMGEKEF